ncbi:MAG: hypothetical protein ACI9QL_001424 [Candidatus Omnitrophota bacterium]|jgi:hypothetical protein
MNTSRFNHTATMLQNGKVLVAGGFIAPGFQPLATAELFDPAAGTWAFTGSMPDTRQSHTATLFSTGFAMVTGGDNNISGALNTTASYNPTTGTWAANGTLGTARASHSAILLPTNTVMVWGGSGNNGGTLSNPEILGLPEIRVVGLYWDQGQSDGADGKHSDYTANLKAFIASVRLDTRLPKLNVFIRKHIFNWTNIDTIITAQEESAKDDVRCFLLDIDLGNREENYKAWAYSPGNGHVSSRGFAELTRMLFDGPLRNATVESFDTYTAKKR